MLFQELQRAITLKELPQGPYFYVTAMPYQYQAFCKI